MKEFDIPTPEQMAEASLRFAAGELAERVTDTAAEGAPKSISASLLYALANDPGSPMPSEIATAMLQRPALRAAYRDFLAGAASYNVPEAVAASSEDLPTRRGDGCLIRFLPSQAEADQIYLVVELDDPGRAMPKALVFCDRENFCSMVELTGWRNSVTQVIVEAGSDILRMARDPKSTAYLK
jgi:hypothetical protein